jgi:5'-nucleotidase
MRILVTNDDGVESEGIKVLASSMMGLGDVYIVAPKNPQSAGSHATTLHKPLRVEKYPMGIGEKISLRVSGTPADCVLLAVDELISEKIDVVVSGINNGPNLGYDIIYSGTVAGAREGAINGILSFAFSVDAFENPNFSYVAKFAPLFIKAVIDLNIKGKVYFNLNFPNLSEKEIKGYRFVKQGRREYIERVKIGEDPFGKEYFWIGGKLKQDEQNDTDTEAVRNGFVAITPLTLDFTDYEMLQSLNSSIIKIL